MEINLDLVEVEQEIKKIRRKLRFAKDIKVDIYNLEEQLMMLPILFFRYSKYVALLGRKSDLLEVELTVATADADRRARKVLKKEDKGPTVDQVKHYVNKKTVPHTKKINKVRYEIKLGNGAIESLRHKRKSLEKLVELYLANYYAEPSLRSDQAKKAMEKQVELRRGNAMRASLEGMRSKLEKVKKKKKK